MMQFSRLIIGVDFDNTIVDYDDLMYNIAFKWGLIDANIGKNKKLIRDAIRRLPEGETHWQRLQVMSYGHKMQEARLMENVKEFFSLCKKGGIPVRIVSHKTEYPNIGMADINLREVAMTWIESQGFFTPNDIGLEKVHVFFESTRACKIERIKTLKVTHFIDDLEETFNEPTFPTDVEKILFAPHGNPAIVDGVKTFASWYEIRGYFLKALDTAYP